MCGVNLSRIPFTSDVASLQILYIFATIPSLTTTFIYLAGFGAEPDLSVHHRTHMEYHLLSL